MSENSVEQPIQKEPLKGNEGTRTEVLENVLADLRAYEVSPVAIIQGGKEFSDLAPRATAEISNRPFLVIQVLNNAGEKQIYKKRMGEDPRDSAKNEALFLQNIVPEIVKQLPEHLKNIIRFPNFEGRHPDAKSLLEEYLEGKIMGSVHKASTELFSSSDLQAIVDVMKIIQTVGGKWIDDPNFHFKAPPERKAYGKYALDLQKREKGLRSAPGNENYERLGLLLKEKDGLLSSEGTFLAASDIQASNIIKMENGQLGMIDWERINVTNNPALDYCFIYAVLWDNPQLQEEYLRYAILQNQDRTNFKEYFRLDFIFNRGTGELSHWWNQMQEAKTPDEKKECEKAIERYTSLIGEAMDKKGAWADNQIQNNNIGVGISPETANSLTS